MSESYTLFLNTQNPVNYTNLDPVQGVCDVQFYINWNAFLPKEHNKFEVTATLKTITSTVNFSATCYIDLSFGSGTSYDQSMSQRSISISLNAGSYSTGAGTTRQFFDTIKNAKGYLAINRPTDNYLRVSIKNSNGTIATGFVNFTLRLKFTPIID